MFHNEKGFTLAESLLAFGFLLIVTVTLFPILFKMMLQLEQSKKLTTAERFLYQAIERAVMSDDTKDQSIKEDKTEYTTYFIQDQRGERACVKYEDFQECMETGF
ncbi:type II secretion system protein [Heyndrickxia acidicola]|uniref:Type II secretion system protein n=1 Tax=Heyndrickxia acidicola TaxID=209389 RepID=A0ABU6MKU3_9BACI|nr:type II secretion system protein [Heyndrickxia acidicola]MED1205145.1 type II secretion system protein [Heyndrickxia acidicola]